ncbi:DUF4290 domain-containing protein [Ohtaekwangia koreensis]|jgi:hypothetical protein|uniref:DUF4290 domain-containing protein n=1 Tax=Ohtaekwangia koreensis TaxID=688867 RepID=A0A1T5JLF2_9BACT|nr:DUF4290 domain-containing protein [Ohtaekwangia koreensis]SKC52241.1 protein of unknown function [Ohtaekwangia koreensis]
MIGEYNSQRPGIILKEYGRNVQKLVEYIRSIPDKEKRTELSYTLIELIKQLTPSIKEQGDDPQRMWDDLYIIADFNLDVNNPFPIPEREILFKKPMKVEYPQSNIRFKHYGKNIEKLVKEALKKEDPQERQDAIIYLGKLMKTFYANWNKEPLDDSVILRDINQMSGGALNMTIDKIREDNLFEKLYKERKKARPQSSGGHQHQRPGGHRPFNKNKGGGGGQNFRRRRDQ